MRKWIARLFLFLGSLAFGAWLAGFFLFLAQVSTYTETTIDAYPHLAATDAIVVLTGGSERLSTGLDLLAAGKGKKLLISGVPANLNIHHILARHTVSQELRDCCIVLGHTADNTVGNAQETRAWMQAEHFGTLRLVTAHYHMPRSLLIFRAMLPEYVITPHPVAPESVDLAHWWMRLGTLRLLMTEYDKYLVAFLRDGQE